MDGCRYPESVTAHVVRRLVTVFAGLLVLAAAVVAPSGPASADEPEGWPATDQVEPLQILLVLVGIPLLIALVIAIGVYVPAMVRGERVAPGAPSLEDQWLGGPRKPAGELTGPASGSGTGDSGAGGAGARW